MRAHEFINEGTVVNLDDLRRQKEIAKIRDTRQKEIAKIRDTPISEEPGYFFDGGSYMFEYNDTLYLELQIPQGESEIVPIPPELQTLGDVADRFGIKVTHDDPAGDPDSRKVTHDDPTSNPNYKLKKTEITVSKLPGVEGQPNRYQVEKSNHRTHRPGDVMTDKDIARERRRGATVNGQTPDKPHLYIVDRD